jgi:hypothetical protein
LELPAPGDPFAETDVVVVSHAYQGSLPENVVRRSEYHDMLRTWNRIDQGGSSICVNPANRPSALPLLLAHGSPKDCRNIDCSKATLLGLAAGNAGDPEMVRALLEAGVSPFVRNGLGKTPLESALSVRYPAPVPAAVLDVLRAAEARQ